MADHVRAKRRVGYSKYDRLLSGAALPVVFRRAKITERQGRAWILNECLNKHAAGPVRKQPGGRALGIDPSTFAELVRKARRKLWKTGTLSAADRALAFVVRARQLARPLTDEEYDAIIGPFNRKRGRSAELRFWKNAGRGAGEAGESLFGSAPAPDVDIERDDQVAYQPRVVRSPRTPKRKVR